MFYMFLKFSQSQFLNKSFNFIQKFLGSIM